MAQIEAVPSAHQARGYRLRAGVRRLQVAPEILAKCACCCSPPDKALVVSTATTCLSRPIA